MKVINAPSVDLLVMNGTRGLCLSGAIELALALGLKTILATSAGFFVIGGRS